MGGDAGRGAVRDADADELGPLGTKPRVEGATVEPRQGEVCDDAVDGVAVCAVFGDEQRVACAAGFDDAVASAGQESAYGCAPVFGLHDEQHFALASEGVVEGG